MSVNFLQQSNVTNLSSCFISLWIQMAGKFCSTSSPANATQRYTVLTKIITCKKGIINTTFTNHNKQQTFSLKTSRVNSCLPDTSLQKCTRHIPVFNWPLTTGWTKLRVTQKIERVTKHNFYSTTSWPQHVSPSSYKKKRSTRPLDALYLLLVNLT